MAYRRRRYGKKRTFRKKRTFKRRIPRSIRTRARVHSFKQVVNYAPIASTSTAAETMATFRFQLDNIVQWATYTALYDQYCISKVVLQFWPTMESPNDGINPNKDLRAYFIKDYNDDAAPANLNEVLQYANCKVRPMSKRTTLVLRPKVAAMIYESATSTAYSTPKGQTWLDTSNTDVPHYGVKVALERLTTGSTYSMGYKMIAYFYIKFRNVR